MFFKYKNQFLFSYIIDIDNIYLAQKMETSQSSVLVRDDDVEAGLNVGKKLIFIKFKFYVFNSKFSRRSLD